MGRFKSLRFDFYVFNFDTMKVILFGKSAEKPYGKLLLTKRNGTQVSYQYLRSDLNWLDNNDTVSYGCIRFTLEPQPSERKNATLIKRVRQIGIYRCAFNVLHSSSKIDINISSAYLSPSIIEELFNKSCHSNYLLVPIL